MDLAGAEVALHVAERAVEIDVAVLRLQNDVEAGGHVEPDFEAAVEAARAPAMRVRAVVAADHGLVAVDVDLRADVVGDALLVGVLAPSVIAAADLAAEGDRAGAAVADLHVAGGDVDDDAADAAARHGAGERVGDFLVGRGSEGGEGERGGESETDAHGSSHHDERMMSGKVIPAQKNRGAGRPLEYDSPKSIDDVISSSLTSSLPSSRLS